MVSSYDYCGPANETNFKNNKHQAQTVDIRTLDLSDLPTDIDIVVGSPPCTQFSFANRGGNGDIADGLLDIIQFFTIVDYLKPKYWAMENVPRLATILTEELAGGRLRRFRHLNIQAREVNMAEFGIPQRRRRCIAGNFDLDLLLSYSARQGSVTLGDVVHALSNKKVVDPLYGMSLLQSQITDHVVEEGLTDEEVRVNRAAKRLHPVYNSMPFPDPFDRTVRTITATCTRVSRESVVIECPGSPGTYRRLSIREKSCLQGFPIDFQFYASSYSQKLALVGNAIPPAFTFLVAQAIQRVPTSKVPALVDAAIQWHAPVSKAQDAVPQRPSFRYPSSRTFRFAIPSLRLKSGVRFELANKRDPQNLCWHVGFYFGNSKSIHGLTLDTKLYQRLFKKLPEAIRESVSSELVNLYRYVASADLVNMQRIWAHKGVGSTRPFMLLDRLDQAGERLIAMMAGHEHFAQHCIGESVLNQYGPDAPSLFGLHKLSRHALLIWAGLLVGSCANAAIENYHSKTRALAQESA